MLGMTVAQKLRRKTKITMTTRMIVKHRVSCTSLKLALIEIERSLTIVRCTEGGMPACSCGIIFLIVLTSSSVFDPG